MPRPRSVQNVARRTIAQIRPRNFGTGDRVQLALSDAGHGGDVLDSNPTLYGLGVELELVLNPFARQFSATVETVDPADPDALVSMDITSFFKLDSDRQYKSEGVLGTAPFGLTGINEADYSAGRVLRYRVTTTSASSTSIEEFDLAIRSGVVVGHCPVAEDCDSHVLKALSKAGVMPYANMATRTSSANIPVSFYFDTLDLLMAATGLAAAVPSYDPLATVGLEFGVTTGLCGPVGLPQPSCAAIDCCCEIVSSAIETTINNISDPGNSVQVNDVVEVVLVVPTSGGANCVGWDALQVQLPGADEAAGFDYLDGFSPVVLFDSVAVAPVVTEEGGGLGADLDFSALPISCGTEIQITWRMQATMDSGTSGVGSSLGNVLFSDAGPCNPNTVGLVGELDVTPDAKMDKDEGGGQPPPVTESNIPPAKGAYVLPRVDVGALS